MNNWKWSKQLLCFSFISIKTTLIKLGRSTQNSAKIQGDLSRKKCLAGGPLRGRCQGTLPLLVVLFFMSWSAAAMEHE